MIPNKPEKMKVTKMIRSLWLCLALLWIAAPVNAAQTGDENVEGGIVIVDDTFTIFPKNRPGNSIYLKNKRLISVENLTLENIIALPEGYIYQGTDMQENQRLGFVGDPDTQFISLENGFYQLIVRNGAKRKLYWISQEKEIIDLLPRYNTATGLAFNQVDKAVFFHISKGETVETDDGRQRYQYTFRLHLFDTETGDVEQLPKVITDFRFPLRLSWLDENTIQYALSNGMRETISVP
jgi:hypothetical protein